MMVSHIDASDLVKLAYNEELKLIDTKAGLLAEFDGRQEDSNVPSYKYEEFYNSLVEIKESEVEGLIKKGYKLVK